MASNVAAFESDRLVFRGIIEADAPLIVKWRGIPEVYRYFKSPHQITLEEHLKWYFSNYLNDENRVDLMAVEKATGNSIGIFGLIKDGESAEVNYILSPSAKHLGYATEGVNRIMCFACEVWNIKSIYAVIHKDNEPSIILVKRLGFEFQRIDGLFLTYVYEV